MLLIGSKSRMGFSPSIKGFTLAEVLITLGIIGVVAAMTIPTLMQSLETNQYKSAYKKTFATISQAYQFLVAENGGSFVNVLSKCSISDQICFKDIFKQKLSYIKDCDSDVEGVCFPETSKVKYLNGNFVVNAWGLASSVVSGLILKDGTSIIFRLDDSSCVGNYFPPYANYCGWISVDTNGLKEPNTWGKDIYIFFIHSDIIRPSSLLQVGENDCNAGSNSGLTCASKYLLN